MKERILRLCKRLDKFLLDEIEMVSELETEELIPILSELKNENKLIQKLMMPAEKAAKKIVKGISKKKKRIVMGADGRSMSFFGRIMPSLTPSLVTAVLRKSKLELFGEVFNDTNSKKGE